MGASIWQPGSIAQVNSNSTVLNESIVATAGQTVIPLSLFTYALGTNSLFVFKNGLQISTYSETSTSSITLNSPALVGDVITVFGFVGITGSVAIVGDGTITNAKLAAGLIVPISQGGTGAVNAANARANLNAQIAGAYAASGVNTDITSLAAPALGAATATTQVLSDNSTKVATTAMVQSAIAGISSSSGGFPSITIQHNTPSTNQMLITFKAPFTLQFRSSSLVSGIPSTVSITSDITLTVSSGATLGAPAIITGNASCASGVVTLTGAPSAPIQIGDFIAVSNSISGKVISFGTYIGGVGTGTLTVDNTGLTFGAQSIGWVKKSRIYIGAVNNGGAAELFIANQAGGLSLEESGLVDTTLMASGSNSNNILYSTTARSQLPYKILAYYDEVQGGLGFHSQSIQTVVIGGGRELAAMWGIGIGQTWQNVTTQRALSQNYVNTKNRPITANIFWSCSAGGATFTVAGVVVATTNSNSNGSWFIVIGSGESYGITSVTGNYGVQLFVEKS